MNFICVGFDIREWPWSGPFNADETGWPRNEHRYAEIVAAIGLWQNEYQLLEVGATDISRVVAAVESWPDCNLLAIEYPADIVRLRDSSLGLSTATPGCDTAPFVCRGLDVCDFRGLFSVLHHPEVVLNRGGVDALPADELLPALELVQYANVLDPSHAPFAVGRLWTLK